MGNIKDREGGKLRPAGRNSDRRESDKQMLNFDEVNYEQRREPYKEGIKNDQPLTRREGFQGRP